MSERQDAETRLDLIAYMARTLCDDLKNNRLWDGEYAQQLANIKGQLERLPNRISGA